MVRPWFADYTDVMSRSVGLVCMIRMTLALSEMFGGVAQGGDPWSTPYPEGSHGINLQRPAKPCTPQSTHDQVVVWLRLVDNYPKGRGLF